MGREPGPPVDRGDRVVVRRSSRDHGGRLKEIVRVAGREPFTTRDALRMARHRMFFSSAKAERELGFRARPARQGLADAVAWFRQAGYIR